MRSLLLIVAAVALLSAGAGGAAAAATDAKAKARASAAKACSTVKRKAPARKRCTRSRSRSRAALRYVAGRGLARGVAGAGLAGALGGATSAGAGAGAGSGDVVAADPVAPADPGFAAPVVASTLGVEARDIDGFLLRLTRTAVPAGNLTIFFRNHDSSKHNLWIAPPAGSSMQISDDVGEGAGATKTVPVTPGSWRLYCALEGHSSMTRSLAVR